MNYFDKLYNAKVEKASNKKNKSKQKVKDGFKRAKKKVGKAFGGGTFSSFNKSNLKASDDSSKINTEFRF
jgi:hypothetical protein